MGAQKGNGIFCSYAAKTLSPHVAQETFIGSQNDKHSDLFATCGKDTVMAVVADSHRSFLIPEQYRLAVCPTTNFPFENSDELCYSFCVSALYHFFLAKSIRFAIKIPAKKLWQG